MRSPCLQHWKGEDCGSVLSTGKREGTKGFKPGAKGGILGWCLDRRLLLLKAGSESTKHSSFFWGLLRVGAHLWHLHMWLLSHTHQGFMLSLRVHPRKDRRGFRRASWQETPGPGTREVICIHCCRFGCLGKFPPPSPSGPSDECRCLILVESWSKLRPWIPAN